MLKNMRTNKSCKKIQKKINIVVGMLSFKYNNIFTVSLTCFRYKKSDGLKSSNIT